MTLFAQSDEDGNLVVGPEKMNNAAPIPASVFTIKTVQHFDPTEDHDGTVPLLTYLGESDQTAREHITDAYANGHDTNTGGDAIGWLAVFLAGGPRWATDVYTAAEAAGHSKDKMKRAKIKLNVSASRESFSGPWFWVLPQHEGSAQGSAPPPISRTRPLDFEAIELALLTTPAVEHMSLPFDPTARRLWGIPVTTTVAATAGTGWVLGSGAVAINTDSQGVQVSWSETSNADDWSRNLIRCRVEGRYATSVFQPLGVVKSTLSA